jgi:hypothetical protein
MSEEAAPDYIEVGRKAHELEQSHGVNAYIYVEKLAADALAEGNMDECRFWKAVEAALVPRGNSN